MHAVSIQEVTSLADSYDLPLICADLEVSIKQTKGSADLMPKAQLPLCSMPRLAKGVVLHRSSREAGFF